jgi:hypothetical protein
MPDEKTGRVYKIVVNHGMVHYGSERERQALKAAEGFLPIAGICFIIAVVWGLDSDDFHIRRQSKPTQ